jgi:hypothetical protein
MAKRTEQVFEFAWLHEMVGEVFEERNTSCEDEEEAGWEGPQTLLKMEERHVKPRLGELWLEEMSRRTKNRDVENIKYRRSKLKKIQNGNDENE